MLTDFRLKVFVVVARMMSFTRAAAELNVSQPAVTKHIKELERLVGGALFLRQGNSISLTDRGVSLLPYAKEILDKYDAMCESIAVADNTFNGTIRLGASTTIAQYVLPAILAKFRKFYPRIDVILTSGNSEDIAKAVIDEQLDIAMVEDDSTNHSLHYEHFADDEIVLVTATKCRDEISVNDIISLPLVVRENGSGTLSVMEKALAKHHIARRNLNIVMQLGSSEGIIRYLLNSDSYAFISIAAASDYLRSGLLKVVDIDNLTINRTFRFVSLHGKHGRLTDTFKQFCKNKS